MRNDGRARRPGTEKKLETLHVEEEYAESLADYCARQADGSLVIQLPADVMAAVLKRRGNRGKNGEAVLELIRDGSLDSNST